MIKVTRAGDDSSSIAPRECASMTSWRTSIFSLALAGIGAIWISPACGDDGGAAACEGSFDCACYPNGTCDEGHVCDAITMTCEYEDANAAMEGQACSEIGRMACGTDAMGAEDVALLCGMDGSYEVAFRCPGLQSCSAGLDYVSCGGTDYAVAGQPCANEDSQVCTIDGAAVLVCDNGEWIEGVHCPPSNCENVQNSGGLCSGHWCANCGYTPGDVCGFQAGSVNCSTDLTKIVQCSNGVVTVFEECAAPTTCTQLQGDVLDCA